MLFRSIAALAPMLSEQAGARLQTRLVVLLGENLPPERLAVEVALLADKTCVDEELVRLQAHMAAFNALLTQEQNGKKLDFIIQEMNREANTIASKSSETDVTTRVIALKAEIEKLREQVQNIE